MKAKTSKILIICLSAVALALLLSLAALIFNPISYYGFEEDGYSFNYRGSFGTARRVVIKNDGEKISTVHIKSDADMFDSLESLRSLQKESGLITSGSSLYVYGKNTAKY